MRHRNGEYRWVISRAKGTHRQAGATAAAGRRRAGHHRAQALRRGAVPREGKRADHAAVHRRWRHHHRRRFDHRLHQSGGRDAHRLAPGRRHGPQRGRGVPRLPRGNLRAAGKSADRVDPPRAADQVHRGPMLMIRRDGNELYVESTAAPIRDGDGNVCGAVLVFHDVSESRELNRKLSYHASHDLLTGLVNRREFESRVERCLQERQGPGRLLRAVPPGHRPVQDDQRFLRPHRGRRAAGPDRRAAEVQDPLARHAVAHRRRRVRHPAGKLHAG